MNKYLYCLFLFLYGFFSFSGRFAKDNNSLKREHFLGVSTGNVFPVGINDKTKLHQINFPTYSQINIDYILKFSDLKFVPKLLFYQTFDFYFSREKKNYNFNLFIGIGWDIPLTERSYLELDFILGPRLKIIETFSGSSRLEKTTFQTKYIGVNFGTMSILNYKYKYLEDTILTFGIPLVWYPENKSHLFGIGFTLGLEVYINFLQSQQRKKTD